MAKPKKLRKGLKGLARDSAKHTVAPKSGAGRARSSPGAARSASSISSHGNQEALQLLSARLLRLQDDERRRIARDLHDVTGQKIAFQSILLSQLARVNPEGEHQRLVTECQTLTSQISDEIRTLSYLLHPPLLDELGLASAAQWYAEGFRTRTGIDVQFDIPRGFARLDKEVEITLFRVLQESLTNVHRYSASPTALVRMAIRSQEVRLEVRDFGRGFAASPQSKREGIEMLGVGILGMRERMRQLSGRLEIRSALGKGTQVIAIVPMRVARLAVSADESAPA